ncbi:MAG: hypothetical protein HUJ26_05850 [Planctomycetaceae bacterium]|nr:hypothetical protein [Planctomycetaceae bacterium]
MDSPLRILISVVCLAVAACCVYGFMASFEPGIGAVWKIGYAAVGISSLGFSVSHGLSQGQ